jgi:hypothetical protein
MKTNVGFILIFLFVSWFLLRSTLSYYQDVKQHSFELAGLKEGKHNLKTGNFYFYFKDPVQASQFFKS